jgi:uncharacterized RDD family membrane protein YckC
MTVIPASYGARVGAYLIDGIVPFVLFIPSLIASISATSMITTGNYEGAVSASQAGSALQGIAVVLLLVYGLIQYIAEANTGMTLGKRAVGLRTVRADTLGPVGFGRILGRYSIIALGGFVLNGQYVVLLSPLWDSEKRNRGWHDKASNTWVLDVKNGPNPLLSTVATNEPILEAATPGIVSVGMPSITTATALNCPDAVESVSESASVALPIPEQLRQPATTSSTGLQTGALLDTRMTDTAGSGVGLIAGVPGFGTVTPTAPVTPTSASASAPIVSISSASPRRVNSVVDDYEDDASDQTRAAIGTELRPRGAVLQLDSGEEFPISGTALLGRNPARDVGEEHVGLVSIADTTRSLSKTHAEIGIDGLRLWVSDRNSTNGTRVRRLDGSEQAVSPTERVYFAPGENVVLGDRSLGVRWQS